MTYFDIVAGTTTTGLDQIASGLYAVPAARTGLFKGSLTKSVPPFGDVVLTYDVLAAPTFVLEPPTAAQWQAAQKLDPTQPRPTANALQVVFSSVSGSVTIGSAKPIAATGAFTVFATLAVSGGTAALTPVAVYLDESSFSTWDKIIVNAILIPQALKMAAKLLSFAIPPIPTFLGLSFQPVVAAIQSDCVIAGVSLTGSPATVLAGVVPPTGMNVFAMSTLTPVNQALANEVNGQTFSEKGQSGPSGWYAAGQIKAAAVNLVVSEVSSALHVAVDGSFSGYGELGGVGVGITKAALCPIGAAADAIANPSDWDKVVASFDIQYSPHPLDVPITLTAAAPDTSGKQAVEVSIGQLGSVQLIYKPTWSGSVTGTVLSAAAAAFIDLVMSLFSKLIVNDVLKKHGQNLTVYTLPPLAQTVDGVTATLTVGAQSLTVLPGSVVAQPFQITFS